MEGEQLTIAVNTRLLIKNKLDGIGRFTHETLKRITTEHKEHHFVFLFDRDFDEEFIFSDNITPLILGPQARHPILFYIWFEMSVANILNKLKPDLFLSPDGYLSLRAKCKSLPVIHDINFAHYPQDLPYTVRKYYNHFFPKFANKATRIATVSEFSKQDIAETYRVSNDKIDVVYNGITEYFKPIDLTEQSKVKNKFTQGADYFLFVGSLQPRKNIARLLQAFDEFKKNGSNNIKLLIVGDRYWWTSEIKQAYDAMQYRADVIFAGRLNNVELAGVYGASLALTYTPYFEGFGIPIIEAMSCDTPVICSNTSSMPEIAGDAALIVDPMSIDSIKSAMIKIYADENLRKELINKGRERKNNFSWDKSAKLLWSSIEKTIKS